MHKHVEQARSDLIADMSYEMLSTLKRIVKMVDLALAESLSHTARNRLLMARSSGESLLAVVDYLLSQSTVETGKLEFEIAEFSLNRMLVDIEAIMLARTGQKELELAVAFGNPVPKRICSDPRRIRQCLFNLLDNAFKFTDKGFVHLRVSTEGDYTGASIRFDIEDSGVGISNENRKNVFDQFDHMGHTMAGRFVGSGLGLAIVNRLVGQLGGSIALTSQQGKGTTSSLTIPAGICLASQEMITELDRSTVEQGPEEIGARLFGDMLGLEGNIDAAVSAINEISWLAAGQESLRQRISDWPPSARVEIPVDWTTIINNCGREDMVALAVQTYIEDAPRIVERLAEAVEAKKTEDVELYAHTLKGASALIGANRLSEAAGRLEYESRVKNIETFVFLFDEVQANFNKVIAFVSEADWMEKAKMWNRDGQ